ncbi:MAG: DUF547 domain-containing protein [Chloroflexi bacterium]|nr:DUF547 domain-containing protein [Chloroflexota bacterium]
MSWLHGAPQLDRVLSRFVDEHGQVDYAALLADGSAQSCARELETFNLGTLDAREERLAFWINAYNCLVIAGVLDELKTNAHYRGVMGDGWFGLLRFFYLKRYRVGGRPFSLTTIENRILRGELREPRVHFALVCASNSCPPLKRGLYAAERIDAELDMAAGQFIRSADGVRVERETHTVWLSQIFQWYRGDFERAADSLLGYIERYLPVDDQAYLARHRPQVRLRYFRYNWQLNGKRMGEITPRR